MSKSSFHNTINLSGEELTKASARAAKQEDLILSIFKANPSRNLSPTQIHSIFQLRYQLHSPITSIRRGLTNLTKSEKLIKTEVMVEGNYGLKEHCWTLNTNGIEVLSEKIKQEKISTVGKQAALF